MKVLIILLISFLLSGCPPMPIKRDLGSLEGHVDIKRADEDAIKNILIEVRDDLINLGWECSNDEINPGWHIFKGSIFYFGCQYFDVPNKENISLHIIATLEDIEVNVKESEDVYKTNLYTTTSKEKHLASDGIEVIRQSFINIYPDMKVNYLNVENHTKTLPVYENEEDMSNRVGIGTRSKEISDNAFFLSYYGDFEYSIHDARVFWYEDAAMLCPNGIEQEVIYLSSMIDSTEYTRKPLTKNESAQSLCDASSYASSTDIVSALFVTMVFCTLDMVTSTVYETSSNTFPAVEGLVTCKN